ncbi:transposase [Telluribacter humicola]|uniref:transposase n=1 Tax=Telluribacter humicola TaxID=1720261 RepID=UPI001A977708|nr:transposase [Telluribacter humicola]
MLLKEGHIYHVYNRGNNRQPIFFKEENYLYFLRQFRLYLLPHCDVLAYCLMPNHFHFMIYANHNSVIATGDHSIKRNAFSEGLRKLLSYYTQAINKQEKRTGSLFTQNTRFRCLTDTIHKEIYSSTCFHYIHQNPMKAQLVNYMEDWTFSSFRDYAGLRKGTLCNQELSQQVLPINFDNFYQESYQVIKEDLVKQIL